MNIHEKRGERIYVFSDYDSYCRFIWSGSPDIGFLFLLPSFIVIIKYFVKKASEAADRKASIDAYYAEEKKAREETEKRKKEALEGQKNLIAQYRNSQVTQEVLKTICSGKGRTIYPEEIIIYDNRIQGKTRSDINEYDFAAHRVHAFHPAIKAVSNEEELKFLIKPQMAMAEAINSLLANKYIIYDNAKIVRNRHTDSDGDTYKTVLYTSDHVTMVLEDVLPNRNF